MPTHAKWRARLAQQNGGAAHDHTCTPSCAPPQLRSELWSVLGSLSSDRAGQGDPKMSALGPHHMAHKPTNTQDTHCSPQRMAHTENHTHHTSTHIQPQYTSHRHTHIPHITHTTQYTSNTTHTTPVHITHTDTHHTSHTQPQYTSHMTHKHT